MKMFTKKPQVLAAIALKNKLYQDPTWNLIEMLERATNVNSQIKICLCMDKGIFKGISAFDITQAQEWGGCTLQVYVVPKFRKKGLGRKLISAITSVLTEEEQDFIYVGTGIDGSNRFWNKMQREGFIS